MKYLLRWMLPVLTILIIWLAVILPPNLSLFQDQMLLYMVHTEEIEMENILPPQSSQLDLIQRIHLVYCLQTEEQKDQSSLIQIERSMSETESTPEERKEMENLLFVEIERLKEFGIIPKQYEVSKKLWGELIYVQTDTEHAGNWFLYMNVYLYDNQSDSLLTVILDRESGQTLYMELYLETQSITMEHVIDSGVLFMNRFGLEYEQISYNERYAAFHLMGTNLFYTIKIADVSYVSDNSYFPQSQISIYPLEIEEYESYQY